MKEVMIQENGVCNQCTDFVPFQNTDSKELLNYFEKIKSQKNKYDALVPLSGGKDSTYVLYLAKQKYDLNILCYTLDNGFMSQMAKDNIERAIKKAGVDHVWYRHEEEVLRKMYRTALIHSGEICGVCGMAIERSMLKVSKDHNIPLILLGHSPTEDSSFTQENIYDQKRLRAILKENPQISKEEVDSLLIFPKMNFITSFLQTKTGRFGRKINILYYEDLPTDAEIGELITKELDWKDSNESNYTRHFDCLAEPFTNYIRDRRFGSSRRMPQLNTMIRNQEITKEEALHIIQKDKENPFPVNYHLIKGQLNISEEDIDEVSKIPIGVFNKHKSRANQVFAIARKILKE